MSMEQQSMAKKQTRTDATTYTWDDALDEDGNETVPMEEQAFLLPDDWDPSTDTNGGIGLDELYPNGVPPANDTTEYGWNEKQNRWIDPPPGY